MPNDAIDPLFFGASPPLEAENGVLAHQVRAGELVYRKGHRLGGADCAALALAGVVSVTIARLEPGDIDENTAAHRLGLAAAGSGVRVEAPFTGRANLFAEQDGVLVLNRVRIDAFNGVDEGMTLASLPEFRPVIADEMVGTVKIIPFALHGLLVEAGHLRLSGGVFRIAPFVGKRVGVLSLTLPGLKTSVMDKTLRITEARLKPLAGKLVFEQRLAHDEARLFEALQALDPDQFDLLLIFGAAAITDRRDVIPRAIERVGGRIEHLGMPVDPGNLLLLAEIFGKPVVGAPGCARSPKKNGFDWILERLCADIPVGAADIRAMGVGGLLMEIGLRPQPRVGA